MIKIVMADDHNMVRSSIRSVLERKGNDMQVVAEFSNGKELLEFAKENDADVYVLDISMPLLNGIEATQKLIKIKPEAKVIILSMYDDRISVEKAIKAGAKGFVVKGSTIDEIIEAIKDVYEDKFFLCSKVSKYVVQGFLDKTSGRKAKGTLTPKEREVLQLIAEGYSSKKIAAEFGLSLNTIHVHRNNIMRKLKIHKQAELIRYALKEGIAHI
ncbi:MAG: response regulator transcription factor [Elusimicrobiota bacterium]|jgi:two-component system NarL family response regulator|nr:response regulator transcription factor [Elusimicrobiota bacterium]